MRSSHTPSGAREEEEEKEEVEDDENHALDVNRLFDGYTNKVK